MPRYQFTFYRTIECAVRINAENEAEAAEIFGVFGPDDEAETFVREGRPRFVKGPKEVFWESSLRIVSGH